MKGVKLDAQTMARKYAVIDRLVSYNKFNHLNKPYYADKALVHMHSSFKIVLERANFIAGEVCCTLQAILISV